MQQDELLFDKDLGLELLMNPKRAAKDNISVSSRHNNEYVSDVSSVKSINVVDVGERINRTTKFDRRNNGFDIETETGSEESIEITNESLDNDSKRGFFQNTYTHNNNDNNEMYSRKVPQNYMNEEDLLNEKREVLYQLDRLEKKGVRLPKKFSLASNLDEMKTELERLKKDRELDTSVKFQRKVLMTTIAGIELANEYFDPIGAKLSGWSENINETIDDYDDIFEELHEKYKGKAKMAPELRLLFTLGGSAFMFHMTNSMFKSSGVPGLDQVLKENPELAKQFANATAKTMKNNTSNPLQSGLGGMFSSLFGGGLGNLFGGGNATQNVNVESTQPTKQRGGMKGPKNAEDILRELDEENEESINEQRVETFSTVTESEMTELVDDASISQLLMSKKKKNRRGLTLEI